MNRFLPLLPALALCLGASNLMAQRTLDSVQLGAGYANQVYYELADGDKHVMPLAGWDIAFELTGYSSGIITNGGANVNLYVVPGKTNADFGTAIDTAGFGGWEHPQNSLATWSGGAFNLGRDYNTGDFGWGEYNTNTHIVSGTTLYVLTLPDGSARQITVDGLASGTYTFRTAMLDGSGSATRTVVKSQHANHHFAYYSVRGDSTFDNEPEMDEWDVVFTKYMDVVGGMPYGVTGVLAAPGVKVAQVSSATPTTEPTPAEESFSDSINAIGYDWKSFTNGAYVVRPDVAFFVHARDGNIYRMLMTGFAGSSTGGVTFEREQLNTVSVDDRAGRSVGSLAIAPNVVRSGEAASLALDLKSARTIRISIVDAAGRVVSVREVDGRAGLQALRLDSQLEPGSYMVAVEGDGAASLARLIVQ